MRVTAVALPLGLIAAAVSLSGAPAWAAHRSAQSVHCSQEAAKSGLKGAERTAFQTRCLKGVMSAKGPTAPTANTQESQAVTKPSGVDRTTRSKQCDAEADRRGLASKERSAYRLSCLATAGPASEGETGTQQPHPGNAIKGIGENNYKRRNDTAKSTPSANPPAMATPHP